jgi:hypothetical protein
MGLRKEVSVSTFFLGNISRVSYEKVDFTHHKKSQRKYTVTLRRISLTIFEVEI